MRPLTAIMLPTFLTQFAAGCYLAVAVSPIRQTGWKYLRLMAVVSLGLIVLAFMFFLRESVAAAGEHQRLIRYGMGIGVIAGAVWLFVNAGQRESVQRSQRYFPLIAGLLCLLAAVGLALRPDSLLGHANGPRSPLTDIAMTITTIIGAALLGSVTAGMLLGHRYLTDTDMSITPLRRLAQMYIAVVICRAAWLLVASAPIWSRDFQPRGTFTWFWLMISIRVGVGVVGVGLFAWMVWDCIKRRATQSATALFYLSMIFVFLGELAGQYLTRTESLAL